MDDKQKLIESALLNLELGKTILNGDNYFVAYYKNKSWYYTFNSENELEHKRTTYKKIKSHVTEYTLETDSYFFATTYNPKKVKDNG